MTKAPRKTFEYAGLLFRQRPKKEAPVFFVFAAPAGEVLQWAAIKRLQDEPGAPQRLEVPAKTRAIKRYLEADTRNTIPTSVLVTLNLPGPDQKRLVKTAKDDVPTPTVLRLSLASGKDNPKPGLVIDGQHRLLGVDAYNGKTLLSIVALVGASDLETAFQFLVVNQKASKVPTDHIRALALEYTEESLADRLRTARVSMSRQAGLLEAVDGDPESPFKGLLDWPRNRQKTGFIRPASVEVALGYVASKGTVFDDDDVLIEFFFAMWRVIRSTWPKSWNDSSRLCSKIGITALTQYITDLLVASSDMGELNLAEPDAVEKKVTALLNFQTAEFWSAPWTATSLDTSAGRKLVVDSLTKISRNKRNSADWWEDVELVGTLPSID